MFESFAKARFSPNKADVTDCQNRLKSQRTQRMKNVVVQGVYIVGMHHCGRRELEVDVVHYRGQEHDNPYDENAMTVFIDTEMRHKVGFLRREDAVRLKNVYRHITGKCYLKAKQAASKFNRLKGPMKICNIGFKCDDEHVADVRQCLNGYSLKVF
ncbi:hypothetical protein DPMN_143523 [Dreissena polymorpha]|uniref:HIRAN domain-containing protein n=1 Tax=Dreissena polymorpha TaxID=45954 RepID=A0A9D4GD76_DREPO|nr:hypothetical protein DPMN_143523 [Dreissena polymorpha]